MPAFRIALGVIFSVISTAVFAFLAGTAYEARIINNDVMALTDEVRLMQETLTQQQQLIMDTNALLIGNYDVITTLHDNLKDEIEYFIMYP